MCAPQSTAIQEGQENQRDGAPLPTADALRINSQLYISSVHLNCNVDVYISIVDGFMVGREPVLYHVGCSVFGRRSNRAF